MKIQLGIGLVVLGVVAHLRVAHAEPKMWVLDLRSVSVQAVGDDDKPTGSAKPLQFHVDGVRSCRLTDDPTGKTFEPWIQGSVDDQGHLLMMHDKGGAPDDVVACAHQALVNLKVASKAGEYRLIVRVAFKR